MLLTHIFLSLSLRLLSLTYVGIKFRCCAWIEQEREREREGWIPHIFQSCPSPPPPPFPFPPKSRNSDVKPAPIHQQKKGKVRSSSYFFSHTKKKYAKPSTEKSDIATTTHNSYRQCGLASSSSDFPPLPPPPPPSLPPHSKNYWPSLSLSLFLFLFAPSANTRIRARKEKNNFFSLSDPTALLIEDDSAKKGGIGQNILY